MNIIKIVTTILLMLAATFAMAQTKNEKIKVSGNCGMCAKKIETAAKDAGATKATWDKKTKVLSVTYDAAKTTNDGIQKKVASVGYDTEKYTADMEVYKNLHECCQYDNKR
ncbi:hypothetical protein GCM10023093_05420 [Nemorincola caseinilytica]|uniref:HMA domain-containing protein n=1 Tax=Nemorincola caseinilytica TaxID=2054315 RepID=A0ABP8N7J7_9BACT